MNIPPMDASDLDARRSAITRRAVSRINCPYFIGADGPDEFDCNGLIEDAFVGNDMGDFYPWDERYSAASWWKVGKKIWPVAWENRAPGDVVCYGDSGIAHHVMMVIDHSALIGACSGTPKLTSEDDVTYRSRMKRQDAGRGARVKLVGSNYWSSARLGLIRIPALTL